MQWISEITTKTIKARRISKRESKRTSKISRISKTSKTNKTTKTMRKTGSHNRFIIRHPPRALKSCSGAFFAKRGKEAGESARGAIGPRLLCLGRFLKNTRIKIEP